MKKKLFVNCSNHASTAWSAAQKAAAEAYGEVVDVKFPAVPMENKYENCHICRRKCENDEYNDGYNQALEDIAQLVQIERGKLGSHLKSPEFMYGWDSFGDVIKKVKLNFIASNKKSSI